MWTKIRFSVILYLHCSYDNKTPSSLHGTYARIFRTKSSDLLVLKYLMLAYSTLSPWFLRVLLHGLRITTAFLGLLAKVNTLGT